MEKTLEELRQWGRWVRDRDPYALGQIRSLVEHLGVEVAADTLRIPPQLLSHWWAKIEASD